MKTPDHSVHNHLMTIPITPIPGLQVNFVVMKLPTTITQFPEAWTPVQRTAQSEHSLGLLLSPLLFPLTKELLQGMDDKDRRRQWAPITPG
jgi:hypothetical protein